MVQASMIIASKPKDIMTQMSKILSSLNDLPTSSMVEHLSKAPGTPKQTHALVITIEESVQ